MVPLRKHLAKIVIVGLMAVPLAATFLGAPAASGEQRKLAAAPAAPTSVREALALPAALDPWINDHFGWRIRMVEAYTRLRHDLFGRFPTNQVIGGRDGRIFLAAHNRAGEGEPYTAIALACGWHYKDVPRIAEEANRFSRLFDAAGIDAKLLIVPSAPIVYLEQLPAWQTERCTAAGAPAYKMLAYPGLDARARERIWFPLNEMRAIRGRDAMFPLTFFHWSGAGPQAVAGMTQERFWKRPASGGTPIPLVYKRLPSDVHFLFPGIEHDSVAGEPDFTGTTITSCYGPDCFPGMKSIMEKLVVAGRFTNTAPGLAPRLVMITDSFGYAGAPWFSRYYSEVVYLSTNGLAQATPEEVAQLRALLFRPGSGDEVLYLYHDATVYSNRVASDLGTLRPEPRDTGNRLR